MSSLRGDHGVRILVINHAHSVVCGIHDLGLRLHARIAEQDEHIVSYAECVDGCGWDAALERYSPDLIVVNYRGDLTGWATNAWRGPSNATTAGIVHNYLPETADIYSYQLHAAGFDWAIFLDQDLPLTDGQAAQLGRPLPRGGPTALFRNEPPVIGTFGFAFPHKQFHLVTREVNERLPEAEIQLHIPEAYFNGASGDVLYGPGIVDASGTEAINPRIVISHTNEHLPPDALVQRLTLPEVNCLFYAPGQPDAGLSSALDYLISARRPILVTDCAMFRHGRDRVALWPSTHVDEILEDWNTHQLNTEHLFSYHVEWFRSNLHQFLERL
jgi:hypothetical protein